MTFNKALSLLVFIMISISPSVVRSNSLSAGFNFDGVLLNETGGAPMSGPVSLTFQILDPSGTCLLFEENHASVTLDTSGAFSIKVGSGVRSQSSVDGGLSWPSIFLNGSSLRNASSDNCAGGYIPVALDGRRLRTIVNGNALSPDFQLAAVPMASVADRSQRAENLQGKLPADFVQVVNVSSQARFADAFDTRYSQLDSLLAGTSTVYASASGSNFVPSVQLNMNSQRISNLAAPSSGADAVNRNYTDGNLAGKSIDSAVASLAVGDAGKVLSWNGTKWVASTASATDSSKLPLAGGTMAGALNMGSNDVLGTGHITMSAQKTLNLGTYTDSQQGAMVGSLSAVDKGKTWFNSTGNAVVYWDGAVQRNIASTNYVNSNFGGNTLDLSGLLTGDSVKWDGSKWIRYTPTGGGGGGTVTSVSGVGPISVGTPTTTPSISISDATGAAKGVVQVGTGINVSTGTISVNYGMGAGSAVQGNDARMNPASILADANKMVRVASGGTAYELRAPAQVLGDIGAAASGVNTDIISLSGLTTPLSLAQGGLGANAASVAQNMILASPNGSAGGPTFRSLVAADIPSGTDASKLPLTGGTMTGAIAMSTFKIVGMGDPTAAQDAATKAYADAKLAGSNLDLTGRADGDAIKWDNGNSKWIMYTPAGGGTVTSVSGVGPISVGTPTTTPSISISDATGAAKGVVQVGTGINVTTGTISVNYGTGAGSAVQGNDARMSPATVLADASKMLRVNAGGTAYELRTPAQVRSDIGATATGDALIVAANAGAGRSAIGAAASGANSDIISLSGLTTPLSLAQGGLGANAASVAQNMILASPNGSAGGPTFRSLVAADIPSGTDASKLPLTGGTMSGAIAMGTFQITGMGDPSLAQDAATKAYADAKLAGSNLDLTGRADGDAIKWDNGNSKWIMYTPAGGGTVTSVSGVGPISVGTPTTTPSISISDATGAAKGVVQVGTGINVTTGTISVNYGTGAGSAVQGNDARMNPSSILADANKMVRVASGGTAYELRTPAQVRSDIGATATGDAVFTAANASAARTAIGATATGDALIIAANAGAARTTIGATATGDALIVAANAGAGRTAIGAAASGANSDISSLSGLTTPLSLVQGGVGVDASSVAANKILASPNGSAGGPTFRSLVAADIPSGTDASKLPLTGGTMTGAIAMSTFKIMGMGDPSSSQDAATKAYADANLAGSNLDLTGRVNGSAIKWDNGASKWIMYAPAGGGINTDITELAGLTAPLRVPFGTQSSPGLAFSGDPSTGVFRTGTGGVGISASGTEVLRVDPAGRVEATGALISKEFAPIDWNINFNLGNVAVVASPGGNSLALSGMVNGGNYTIIITDTTSRTYNFGGDCSTPTTFFRPANGPTINKTVYTIIKSSAGCFVSWITDFS